MPPLPVARVMSLVALLALALGLVAVFRSVIGSEPDNSGDELIVQVTTTVTTAPTPSTTEPGPTTSTVETVAPRFVGHYEPQVLAEYPHDVWSFTQGLEWSGDLLLESSGPPDYFNQRNVPPEVNRSSLRLVEPETGEVVARLDETNRLFAEGVTVYDGRAHQLTYQDRVLLVTDVPSLSAESQDRRTDAYQGEGWGLCYDGSHLVMSNGSPELVFRNPESFEIERTVETTLNDEPLQDVNELECVNGQVWANIWQKNTIVAIDPATGTVEATVDAGDLEPDGLDGDQEAVLNGIAYNPDTETFWLTGKLWPVMYEVTFEPVDQID